MSVVLVAAFLLIGPLIGESLRFVGLDRMRVVQKYLSVVLAIGLVAMISLARTDYTEVASYFGIVSGLTAGFGFARDRQEAVDDIWQVLCCSCPVVFFVVSVLTQNESAFIPAVADIVAVGTGYGMCPSIDDYFLEKKRGDRSRTE